MPFVGITTFAGYPLWQPDKKTDAVVLGIPYDEGTTYRPGARFGPRAIRDASMFYNYERREDRFYDADRRRWMLSGKAVADAGDVEIEPLSLKKNWKSITEAVQSILKADAIPAVMGGDHSVTYPVVKALAGAKLHYIHLDTHADCDRIFESKFTHGSPVVRILEEGLAESITIIGVRGLTNSGRDFSWINEQDVRVITARELRDKPLKPSSDLLGEGDFYVSLDIDFFDPSAAPGTGTPEPGGLFFPDFSDVIQSIASRGNIIAFDVVEVNPLLDGRGAITAHLGARCILELLSAALDRP
ncbi:MAG: agmatinase [Proteobacteria bacterium]|nr:agmatinase [Pseudomonadota bacterium]